ncbi:MAG: hypothetical protein N3A65_10230, partial [candidate division WOR-3 bacterium]|nr:hypothetical protein [candidate division WOR-3 bacterium]
MIFLILFLISQNLPYDSLIVDTLQTTEADTTKITFDFKEADIRDVLRAIAVQLGVNIVVDKDVEGKITVHLEKIGLE